MTDKTCTVNSVQGKDFTVTLPTVSQQVLANTGDVAGRTTQGGTGAGGG